LGKSLPYVLTLTTELHTRNQRKRADLRKRLHILCFVRIRQARQGGRGEKTMEKRGDNFSTTETLV